VLVGDSDLSVCQEGDEAGDGVGGCAGVDRQISISNVQELMLGFRVDDEDDRPTTDSE
jgi:hypothetical protein